jgi:ATP-binding cassette subfamily F protein 3
MLGNSNILVLDEPGNHLDVETIESLADALIQFEGTVIFTSHDRHFMKRIATSIIEVGRGTARNYQGDYDAYLYYINQEIDDGRRSEGREDNRPSDRRAPKVERVAEPFDERKLRKELSNLEKKIARLDDEKRAKDAELMTESDPANAMKLHEEVGRLQAELGELEVRWLELQEILGPND